jgi:hypothetical protein
VIEGVGDRAVPPAESAAAAAVRKDHQSLRAVGEAKVSFDAHRSDVDANGLV